MPELRRAAGDPTIVEREQPMSPSSAWWRGSRGEWWVVGQLALMALVFFGPRTLRGLPDWPSSLSAPSIGMGAVLMVAGGLLLGAGLVHLGRSLTPLPHPKDDSVFVASGPYRFVCHPMYAGGALLAVGWALAVRGLLTLGYAAVLFAFLEIKATREERWLVAKFSEYRDYQRRVAELVPWLH